MASPITWRNVEGPDLGQASRGLFLAGQTFNQGFDKIGDVLKSREALDAANWEAQKVNNTAAFMQQMRQYQTPEALAAAQASGALDPSRFQAQIDQPLVNSALDARRAILQQRGTADITYKNTMRDDAEAGRRDQFLSAAQLGDTLTMNLLRNDPVREQAKLEQAGVAANQLRLAAEYAASEEGRRKAIEADRVLKAPLDRAAIEQTTATSAASAKALEAQAKEHAAAATLRENEAKYGTKEQREAQKAIFQKRLDESLMKDGEFSSTKGRAAITKSLKDAGRSGSQLESLYQNVQSEYPNGIPVGKDASGKTIYKPVPTALIQEAADLTRTGFWSSLINPTFGGAVVANLNGLLKDPTTLKRLEDGYQAQHDATYGGRKESGSPGMAADASKTPEQQLAEVLKQVPQSSGVLSNFNKTLVTAQQTEAQKKSSEIGVPASPGTSALPVNRAVETHPTSKVTGTAGFALGNPGAPAKPLDTSNTTWGKAQEVVSAGVASRKAAGTKAFVLTVGDGDSLTLGGAPGGPANLVCRLDAIDAPETAKSFTKPAQPGQPYGQEALDTLKKLVANKEVTVTVTRPTSDGSKTAANNYGRALCQIDVQGKDVNSEMLAAGSAWLYEQFGSETPLKSARRELQNAAIANKAGVHGLGPQQMPWDYRREQNKMKDLR